MLLVIPHLFATPRLLEAGAQNLHLPALQTLLARGSRQACPAEGGEAALCAALGIVRQQDWPIAPILLEADDGIAADAYWLRADPVHLQVMRDRIVLAGSKALSLSHQEADALANTISQHFGTALSPLPLHPKRWYLRLPAAPHLTTTPLSLAAGCAIAPILPQGDDAKQFRTLLNELQMLLHDHPVNQAREARGELPVNSLWLWGGGKQPTASSTSISIYTDNIEAKALGTFCGARVHALPKNANSLAENGIVLLDTLTDAGQVGDAFGWRESLRDLEQNWFASLQGALRNLEPHGLRLIDPVNGQALQLYARDAWRFWRRPRSLISMLS